MIIGKAHVCSDGMPHNDHPVQRYFRGDVWECDCRRRYVLRSVTDGAAITRGRPPTDQFYYYWDLYTEKTQEEINSDLGRRPASKERTK